MRNVRDLLCLAFGLLLVALVAAGAQAQGVIVPGPCRRCPPVPRPVPLPRSLPVKSVKIETKINGQVATTHVEQVFRNDTDQTLEGTYFFPIPESASISEFAIWDGDRRLVGEVRTREEARRIYDEIVRRQRDPGLLEYAGRDLFQASIFPIPPRSDKKLELTYTQVLKAESGTVAYRYPLGTGRNVSQITGTVSGSVEVEGQKPLRNVYSPTHEIDVRNSEGGRRARVSFETKAGREPQDFQLFYTLSDADFGMTLLTHREPGKQGYFLLTISPKDDLAEREYSAKDIVFVLDTSGSMAEAGKMEKARAALLFGVRSLKNEDRFNVVNFAGEEHLMAAGLVQADAAGRARGEEFIRQLRPVGGTNINGALQASMRLFDQQNDRPRMLVFMTDGLPTVGETKVDRIIENARAARVPGVRLFTFGVGYDVNTALLDKLAAENGGVAEYVDPKEDLEVKVSSFFTKINHPVLTALALDMGGVETDFVYPRELPDLFRGGQVTLIGRYRNPSDVRAATLALTGRAGRDSRKYPYENISFPLVNDDNDFLPRLWATRRVGWLMEQVRSNGEQKELVDEITDLGTRYGIVTPYTSYLALEPGACNTCETTTVTGGPGGAGGGQIVTRQLGGQPRSGRDASTGGVVAGDAARMSRPVQNAPPPPASKDAAKATTGEMAVRESRRARAQQETIRVESDADDAPAAPSVRKVGDKTFYLREGIWTDAEFKADARLPETALEFGGEEYFALVRREPQLARFFALGERVVVVFKGRVYRVGTK
ncbi:MAG TPA: VIT and VWA domain-containing protein [Pyrinomonadaceae bacterium]|nr:VIT and VWA domain-containing protein [Pyrinomonadaceae bacterium]